MSAGYLWSLLMCSLGTLAICVLCVVPRRAWVGAMLTADLAYSVQHLMQGQGADPVWTTFVCAFVVGCVAEALARLYKVPSQCCSFPGIVPLAPGLTLYQVLYDWADKQYDAGEIEVIVAIKAALAIALGLVVATSLLDVLVVRRREQPGNEAPARR